MKATVTNITKRIEQSPSKIEGIVYYDIDNIYPQRVTDILNSSGTGTLCSEMMQKFINGKGFVAEALAKTVVNSKRLTANKLLFKSAKDLSAHNGFIIHINYDMNFRKISFSSIPFSHGRLTDPKHEKHGNMLAVYDNWDRTIEREIDEKKIDYINFYNPDPTVIQKEVEKAGGWEAYKGQVMYWTPEGIEYVLAPSDAVLEDIQTDSQAKTFKNKNITTNFMASHIVEVPEFEKDPERQEFIQNLTDFQGAPDALKMFLLEKKAGQEGSGFNLQKIDIQDVDKLYEYTETSVRDNIIRRYQIPPILLLSVPGKLGSSSEISEATALYNGTTDIYRIALSEVFRELFNNSIFVVGEDFDIEPIRPSVTLARDTPEGQGKVIDIIFDETIQPGKKMKILTTIYKYSEEEALELTASNNAIQ